MAEARTPIPSNDTWIEVLSAAPSAEVTIQNIGNETLVLRFTDTAPDNAETWGFMLAAGEADRRSANLTKIYARPLNYDDGVLYTFTA